VLKLAKTVHDFGREAVGTFRAAHLQQEATRDPRCGVCCCLVRASIGNTAREGTESREVCEVPSHLNRAPLSHQAT
jgi:hypothetical protein